MKKNIINIIISILLLIIAASLILFINKITTPIILESDLLERCREAGGEYHAYQFDKDDEVSIYC